VINVIKKIVACLMAICIVSATAFSCTQATKDPALPEGGGDKTAGETEPADDVLSDGLEPRDFGGRAFVMATRDDTDIVCRHMLEVYAESITGEVLNDAVYNRNITIEERFNCKIVPKLTNEKDGELTREMQRTVLAGDVYADVAIDHMINMSAVALKSLFYNWYDAPSLDFSKPWWNETATKELQVAGKSFFAFSDMLISGYDRMYAIIFNKKLYTDFGIADNPYTLVNEGKWTIDKFWSLTKDLYLDLNGNGSVDLTDDLFGFVSNAFSATAAWPWAFNHFITRRNADGYPEIILNNEKSAQITLKMYDYYYNTPGWSIVNAGQRGDKMWWDYVTAEMFPDNKAVFGTLTLCETLLLRSMEEDYGILPMPKWDEGQDRYHTMIDGHGPLMAIPMTSAENIEMIGTMMEVLAAESYKQVIPAYYEISLKNKQLRDEESIQMLDDYIKPGVLFDFGFIYDGWSGFAFWLSNILQTKKSEFASYYEKSERAVTNYYEKVIAVHDNYGN